MCQDRRVVSVEVTIKPLVELLRLQLFFLTFVSILYIMYIYRVNRGDTMTVLIDNRSGTPIYDQIYTQIRDQIISGALAQDEMLPSIRSLAKDLRISFITTKRAYEELEREGFIYTVPAKGCYVAQKNTELLREENLKKIEAHMEQIVRLAATCGLSKDDLLEMMKYELEDMV